MVTYVSTDLELSAVHGMNKYLWSQMQAVLPGSVTSASYGGWIPIMPVADIPSFRISLEGSADPTLPYVIYNWTTQRVGDLYVNPTDQIVYIIYGLNEKKVRILTRLIHEIFKKKDDSAEELNDFIRLLPDEPATNARFKQFIYKWTAVPSIISAIPIQGEEEDRRVEVTMMVEVSYTQF